MALSSAAGAGRGRRSAVPQHVRERADTALQEYFRQQEERTSVLSPDGKQIAFLSGRDGDTELYVKNADGTGVRQVTYTDLNVANPVWSPDSRMLAFELPERAYHYLPDGIGVTNEQLWVIGADGTWQTQITTTPAVHREAAWSPDSKMLAFVRILPGNMDICVANADGSSVRNITKIPWSESGPTWAPDGVQIAYTENTDRTFWICRISADGTGRERLTEGLAWAGNPCWLPDGRIAFISHTKACPWVFAIDPDTRETTRAENLPPMWERDFKWSRVLQYLQPGVPVSATTRPVMVAPESVDAGAN
jgi:TolB protein